MKFEAFVKFLREPLQKTPELTMGQLTLFLTTLRSRYYVPTVYKIVWPNPTQFLDSIRSVGDLNKG